MSAGVWASQVPGLPGRAAGGFLEKNGIPTVPFMQLEQVGSYVYAVNPSLGLLELLEWSPVTKKLKVRVIKVKGQA